MNNAARWVLGIAFVLIVVVGVFPPWYATGRAALWYPGYHFLFLFNPRLPRDVRPFARIDATLWTAEIIIILAAGGVAWLLLKGEWLSSLFSPVSSIESGPGPLGKSDQRNHDNTFLGPGMLRRLNRPVRAAIVFTLIWFTGVGGLAAYERFVTIGNTDGPWALYGHYGSLIFYHVQIEREPLKAYASLPKHTPGSGIGFSSEVQYWIKSQLFFTTLLLPPGVAWVIAVAFVPAFRWVRDGMHT